MKVVNRIKKSEDFLLVIKKGRVYRSKQFTIHVAANKLAYTRVGLSVSAKIGNAVTRNRIKRQVRSMCDSLIEYNKYSLDIVVVVRKPYLDGSFNENKSHLCDLLSAQVGKN